jgi:hypothetical protein
MADDPKTYFITKRRLLGPAEDHEWGTVDTPWSDQIDASQNVEAGAAVIPASGLSFGLRDDFAGTSLSDRPDQQTGVYDAGSTTWPNAQFRPSWTPASSGTYKMDDGSLIVRDTYAEIRAPAPHIPFTDGFRYAVDVSHDRSKGRMRASLGHTDEGGEYTPCVTIGHNTGNNSLRIYIHEQQGERTALYNGTRSVGTSWSSWELTYDGVTWAFKRNGSVITTSTSIGEPWITPNTTVFRNTAYDGEGGRWRDLTIDAEVS